jgi:DNA-binding response OmpR family regulator
MAEKQAKIILIEDDITLREMYRAKLMQSNYQVFEAEDAEQGMQLILDEQPDLILLDLILPKGNGFELLERIKSNLKTKKIPIIVLTSLGQSSDRQEVLDLGAADYLVKPETTLPEIISKIKEHLVK